MWVRVHMWAIPKILDFLGVPTMKAMEQYPCSCGDIDWGLTSADTSHMELMYRIFPEVTQWLAGKFIGTASKLHMLKGIAHM